MTTRMSELSTRKFVTDWVEDRDPARTLVNEILGFLHKNGKSTQRDIAGFVQKLDGFDLTYTFHVDVPLRVMLGAELIKQGIFGEDSEVLFNITDDGIAYLLGLV